MKRLLLVLLITSLLVGCGETESTYDGAVSFISIRIDDTSWYVVPYFYDDFVTSTDGYAQWVFNSGGTIMTYQGDMTRVVRNTNEFTVYDEQSDTTMVIQNNKDWSRYLNTNIVSLKKQTGKAELLKQFEIANPYAPNSIQYTATNSGVCMPSDYSLNTFLMPCYKNGISYFTSGMRYKNEKEMYDFALSYLKMYDGGDVYWFYNGNDFVARNENVGVGYKKLTVNKYVFYVSSSDMFDYVLLNVQGIK